MTLDRHNLLTSARLSRLGMALVVALLAVTPLAGFAHFALVEHAQCPEHGEWMHVHGGTAHAVASAQTNWHSQEVADGHDHCSAPTALRDRVTPRQPTVQTETLVLTVRQPAPQFPPAPVATRHASWRTAPKTSPPA